MFNKYSTTKQPAMKTPNPFILFLLLLLSGIIHANSQDVLTVAIFDFDSKDESVSGLGPKVATLVNADLSAEPRIITVERTELEKVLGEQELGLSGTVNPSSAAKIGQLTGAKVLVTGRVFKAEEQTVIVAKIISTETSRVYGETVQGPPTVSIVDLSSNLATKIAGVIAAKSETLVAKTETREERVSKIKQSIAGKKLPVVLVKLSEHHYGPHIIDPAAETELFLILQQCGFKLADAASTLKPDVEISGDAFSAYGMQKGNLISCKSRVELKVRDVATGNILVTDRQTNVGVDVAEQTAAKTALQNAADELAERIIPQLSK
jgi:Curli production assembly/transport component CsgG